MRLHLGRRKKESEKSRMNFVRVRSNDGNVLVNPRRQNVVWNLTNARDTVPRNIQEDILGSNFHILELGCMVGKEVYQPFAFEPLVIDVLAANQGRGPAGRKINVLSSARRSTAPYF